MAAFVTTCCGFLILLGLFSIAACQNESVPVVRNKPTFCHTCSGKTKQITDKTSCTSNTFKTKVGVDCKGSLCYTEIYTPVVDGSYIFIKRGCAMYSINACMKAVSKRNATYTKCIKTCNSDRCNTDVSISFSGNDSRMKTVDAFVVLFAMVSTVYTFT